MKKFHVAAVISMFVVSVLLAGVIFRQIAEVWMFVAFLFMSGTLLFIGLLNILSLFVRN